MNRKLLYTAAIIACTVLTKTEAGAATNHCDVVCKCTVTSSGGTPCTDVPVGQCCPKGTNACTSSSTNPAQLCLNTTTKSIMACTGPYKTLAQGYCDSMTPATCK